MKTQPHILFIGAVWPEPASSAGGSRTMQLVGLFQEQNWKITFSSVAAESEFAVDLSKIGIEKAPIELNSISFDHFISTLRPDIVVFDKFMTEEQFGWRVAEHCPEALRILDTIDLHCLRHARRQALKEKRDFVLDDLVSDVSKREIASILRCDLSLVISDLEMSLLTEYFHVDEEVLLYLPFMLEPVRGNFKKFEARKGFVTIGNFLHEPNWDSVLYLKECIWPLIRKRLPEAELCIYGAYASQKVEQLHKPSEGFIVKGRAEDALSVISEARVLLAPLRFGAGIKGKLSDAMVCGTPCVTSSIGAEGMCSFREWNGVIADEPEYFADAAVELYLDKKFWLTSQKNGISIVNELFSKKELGEHLLARIDYLITYLKKHRVRNFYGAMLLHHTVASTRYLAKWIEEKNKK